MRYDSIRAHICTHYFVADAKSKRSLVATSVCCSRASKTMNAYRFFQHSTIFPLQPHNCVERFGGIPNEVVDQDQARREIISHLMRQVVNSPKKQELMQEPISRRRKIPRTLSKSKGTSKLSNSWNLQRRSSVLIAGDT